MKNDILKEVRNDHNLTQQQVADILEVKRGTYASWECGNDIIPTKQIYNLANYYSMSVDYLLGLSNKNKKVLCQNEIDKKVIGNKLAEIRTSNKLSQAKIANAIDINQSTYWAYEKGITLITTTSLIAIAKTYNYKVDYILNRCKEGK